VSVTPAILNLQLPEGGSTTITKTVTTPAIPPNPDIVFLADTTTSMGPVIGNVQSNIATILSTIRAAQPTSQFAVAMYKDTADLGSGIPFFTVLQGLTADTGAVQTAVNKLTPLSGGGTDAPEDFINALFQVATGAISFRPNGVRLVVWIGDASSHDPSDGHTLPAAISALQAAHVRVIALDVGPTPGQISDGLDATGQATAITGATGGQLFKGVKPDQVSATILAGLHNLPVTVQPVIVAIDPHLAVSFNPGSQTVTSGTNAVFAETISVSPAGTPGSTLIVKVDFLLNGQHQDGFIQTITNSVPKHATVLAVSDATSDFHDPGTVSAVLTDGVTKAAIAGAAVSFTMEAESCSAGTAKYTVTLEETTTEYTGPTVLANGSTVVLTGVLKEDGLVPINGRLRIRKSRSSWCPRTAHRTDRPRSSRRRSPRPGAGSPVPVQD